MSMLLNSPMGLLTVFTIGFIICMAIFLFFWIKKQVEKDENQPRL
ncbi:DUF3149 domain-containing protein [Alysiella crassa]|uniref:DUF3149 domain-containing protein n=1 Tax=Alysiella crassa TaxID=153491 RepID=A0A376BVM4_9NEIS|nr:DUF3149 domain-containing protein [Alysiella crassa]UOP06345.1 CorA family divalent cation transporter [Alysiella crassa]SSY80855.1 Uncharacterised protein [Alysiella crassa]